MFAAYFVNITGVIYDEIEDKYYYEISSWGQKYII